MLESSFRKSTPLELDLFENIGQWGCQRAEISDNAVVELRQSVETPHIKQRLRRQPVTNSGGLGWIDCYPYGGDDEAEERNRCAQERTFGDIGEEFFFLEFGADRPELVFVFGGKAVVDENIIKIDHEEITGEGAQHFIHQLHECTRGIREAERHYEPFAESFAGFQCCFPFITCTDPHLMVTISKVQLGEYLSTG